MRGDPGAVLPKAFEEPGTAHHSRFCIGGVSVEVIGGRSEDATLIQSLEPFRVDTGVSDICIQVKWAASIPRMPGRPLFDSGTTWRLYEGDTEFQFDFNSPVFGERPYKRLFVDKRFRRAMLQMSEDSFNGFPHVAEPLEYPLDELLIMHRLTQERAIELHSCGIVSADGAGNLFVGHSGAGKSTTTRLWTASQDVEILSDDRIIVRLDSLREEKRDEGAVETHRGAGGAASGQQVLGLGNCSASWTSRSAQDHKAMRMYGTPWHGEAAFASPGSAPLTRILVLEHGHGNVLTRLSSSQAVAELFARSFVPMHRHEYVESALGFLQEVAESVPCYRFAFEPHQGAVEKILALRD
jgi:hypothetical protein